jgi:hypothetical protein
MHTKRARKSEESSEFEDMELTDIDPEAAMEREEGREEEREGREGGESSEGNEKEESEEGKGEEKKASWHGHAKPVEDEDTPQEKRYKWRIAENQEDEDLVMRQTRETYPEIVERARAMRRIRQFRAFKYSREEKRISGIPTMCIISSDENRHRFFEALFGDDPHRPHLDTFRAQFADHLGVPVDKMYPFRTILSAMEESGLEKQSIDQIETVFFDYMKTYQKNDLMTSFRPRIPEWDGTPRLETRLIDLFQCNDTPLTRKVGLYFWLSLYNRITSPGCLAPIVISLFGAQHAGKTRFSDSICQIVLNDPKANAVQVDLAGDFRESLRAVTGHAVVGNIGEMIGYNRGNLNKINARITATADNFDQKYLPNIEQKRQWIFILDGNKYTGLQRDETGNRRFYPIFVGQLPDKDGQPAWQEKFEADWTDFEVIFWQLMAECRAWMEERGMDGYNELVKETVRAVFDFNAGEMKAGRGLVRDPVTDCYLPMAMIGIKDGIKWRDSASSKSALPPGVAIYVADVIEQMEKANQGPRQLRLRKSASRRAGE